MSDFFNFKDFVSYGTTLEDADWKEGINAFRLDVRRQIEQLQHEIKTLKKKINNKKP